MRNMWRRRKRRKNSHPSRVKKMKRSIAKRNYCHHKEENSGEDKAKVDSKDKEEEEEEAKEDHLKKKKKKNGITVKHSHSTLGIRGGNRLECDG